MPTSFPSLPFPALSHPPWSFTGSKSERIHEGPPASSAVSQGHDYAFRLTSKV